MIARVILVAGGDFVLSFSAIHETTCNCMNFIEKIYFLDSGKDVLIETYIHGENLFCSSISYLDEFNEQGVKAFENIKMSYCDLDEYLKAAGVNERKALKKISGFYN